MTGSFFKSTTREELLLRYVSRFTNTLIRFSRENSGFESHSSATDLPPWGAVAWLFWIHFLFVRWQFSLEFLLRSKGGRFAIYEDANVLQVWLIRISAIFLRELNRQNSRSQPGASPFHQGSYQISCISDVYVIIHKHSKISSYEVTTKIVWWLGITAAWGAVWKCCSVRKVESHCVRQKWV